jgi:hypothetical protein
MPPLPPTWVGSSIDQSGGRLELFSASLPGATGLTADRLSEAVARIYREVAGAVTAAHRFPIRIWNFVPDIQAPMGAGDRYMAFNLGRFLAYADWFGNPDTFSASLPTASAVGVCGDTLWIHILAADRAGVPIENPRQIPAYLYSRRYGIRPPCFARATSFEGTLLIGGTASILGEDSRHADNIDTQTHETFRNIAALITAGRGGDRGGPDPLATLTDLRVHVLHASDAEAVRSILDEVVPGLEQVEFVQAALCRRELLVEIEGRARL